MQIGNINKDLNTHTSNAEAISFIYAFGVKKSPSARIFNANSMDMKKTKMYSAIWSAGLCIIRLQDVSNIMEIQESVVTKIITQSR